jgi:hypothetical protein
MTRPDAIHRKTGMGTDLWRVVVPPVLWAGQFLFVYVLAAVHCEKAGRGAPLAPILWPAGVVTAIALAAIAVCAATLWKVRARSLTDDDFDFEHDSPEERHRFLSHVALMLCVLSAVAIGLGTTPLFLLSSCR